MFILPVLPMFFAMSYLTRAFLLIFIGCIVYSLMRRFF